MRVSLQPAYILHSRPYRDSSALLEVLTAEHGRVSLVAKGARRQSRRGSTAALVQPFTPLLLSFSGRTDLRTLTGTEVAGAAFTLRKERLFSGMYLNELLVRLLHHFDPHPTVFAAYGDALEALCSSAPVDVILRRFELILLAELGYRLDPGVDGSSGQPVIEGAWYQFEPAVGLVLALEYPERHVSRYAGAELLQIASGELGGELTLSAKRLLREALAVHLGDAPLRSRDLFRNSGRGLSPVKLHPSGSSA